MTKNRKTVRKLPIRAAITGVFGYVPPDILSNAELAQMVETSDEWIMQRVGIRERHIAPPEMATSDMAVLAACATLAHPA